MYKITVPLMLVVTLWLCHAKNTDAGLAPPAKGPSATTKGPSATTKGPPVPAKGPAAPAKGPVAPKKGPVFVLPPPLVPVVSKSAFYINFCAPSNQVAMNFYILNAMDRKWPLDNFCQAVSSGRASYGSYDMTVYLYNFKGSSSGNKNYGHPGVILNARDSLNYDFVYFRPHSTSGCYQTGYMSNGEVKLDTSSYCPDGQLVGKTWTSIQVKVRPGFAYVLMRNRLVDIVKFKYGSLNRGGALAANGYQNLVFFRNYRISKPSVVPLLPSSRIKGCSAGTGWMNFASLVLNADNGAWPAAGFCRVQHHDTLTGTVTKYQLTARLYNIRSKTGANTGHPGVMYNVQDMDNFDFVYFRPHSTTSCYQTGYVVNGAFTMTGSSTCPGGPPTSRNGFMVNVKVNSNSNAQIFINNQHVKTLNPHFSVKPIGGVIAANGYENIVQTTYFNIHTL